VILLWLLALLSLEDNFAKHREPTAFETCLGEEEKMFSLNATRVWAVAEYPSRSASLPRGLIGAEEPVGQPSVSVRQGLVGQQLPIAHPPPP